jgi:hypothetical protein
MGDQITELDKQFPNQQPLRLHASMVELCLQNLRFLHWQNFFFFGFLRLFLKTLPFFPFKINLDHAHFSSHGQITLPRNSV